MKFLLGFALGVGLILDRIFLRVRPTGLDLVVVVEHRPWRRLFIFRHRVDHEPALPGILPDVGLGRIGLAQLGLVTKQRIGHWSLRQTDLTRGMRSGFGPVGAGRSRAGEDLREDSGGFWRESLSRKR